MLIIRWIKKLEIEKWKIKWDWAESLHDLYWKLKFCQIKFLSVKKTKERMAISVHLVANIPSKPILICFTLPLRFIMRARLIFVSNRIKIIACFLSAGNLENAWLIHFGIHFFIEHTIWWSIVTIVTWSKNRNNNSATKFLSHWPNKNMTANMKSSSYWSRNLFWKFNSYQ